MSENLPQFNSYAKHLKRDHSHVDRVSFDPVANLSSVPLILSVPTLSSASVTDLELKFDSTTDNMDCNVQDHKNCAAAFVAKMYSTSNSTLTEVQRSIDCTKELIDKTIDCLQQKKRLLCLTCILYHKMSRLFKVYSRILKQHGTCLKRLTLLTKCSSIFRETVFDKAKGNVLGLQRRHSQKTGEVNPNTGS